MVLAPGYLWGLAGIPTDGRAYGAEGNPIPASWGISKTSKRGWTNLSCPVRGRDFFRNTKDAGGIKTLYRHMLSLSFEYVPVIYLPDGQYRFHGSARQRKAAGSCRPREQERSTP